MHKIVIIVYSVVVGRTINAFDAFHSEFIGIEVYVLNSCCGMPIRNKHSSEAYLGEAKKEKEEPSAARSL